MTECARALAAIQKARLQMSFLLLESTAVSVLRLATLLTFRGGPYPGGGLAVWLGARWSGGCWHRAPAPKSDCLVRLSALGAVGGIVVGAHWAASRA